ncbi:hypothetical protein PANT111_130383 [Pantoea brenneri]|uniref:Uncharacterized protein n=1 Tax=Pantoea brenneri TaxID=472694 RepID=A0AAX3J2C0_9GAMM|nr:hypothetical protein PANT111_130383 [Pantoea brenneri]
MDYTVTPCFRNPYQQANVQLLKKPSLGFSGSPA